MRERLGEIADHPAGVGVKLLGQQSNVIAQVEQAVEGLRRVIVSALKSEIVGEPEGAEQERPLAGRQSIDVLSG